MKPSIGRMVHYVDMLGAHWPAVITRVNESGSVDLQIFGFRTMPWRDMVYADESNNSNTWHWPEREG